MGLPHYVTIYPPGGEMKQLAAAIALLCLSTTVLAHDIYTNLRDRDGNPCWSYGRILVTKGFRRQRLELSI
jgi:hypothetical protein